MEQTILLFLTFSIEAFILWKYTSSLFTPSHSRKIRLALLCVFYAALFCLSFCSLPWLNVTAYFLANGIFIYTQFQTNFRTALFYSAVLVTIMGGSEFLCWGGFAEFLPHFEFWLIPLHRLIFLTIFSKILFYIIVCLLIRFIKRKYKKQTPANYSVAFLCVIPFTSVFILITFVVFSTFFSFPSLLSFMVSASTVGLLLTNLLVFGTHFYTQKKAKEFLDMQLLLQREQSFTEYYEMLLDQKENQSILLHDLKKHLQSIALLNHQHEHEKIDTYIQNLLNSTELNGRVHFCEHELLNAILCRYQKQCQDKGIDFHTDIRRDTVERISHLDMTSLFCNLLDNAVEAAEAAGDPHAFIELSVRKKEDTPFVVIILQNSCSTPPATDRNGFPVSRKSDTTRHGFGMKSIQKTARQYHGELRMYFDDVSHTFHTILTLKISAS